MSLISILILTYNRCKLSKAYIPQIIDRIGDIDAEVLVWDNCSCDGTLDWLVNYAKADDRVTEVFAGEANYGLEAINFLAKKAKGKYLLKIDDDIIVPNAFAQRLVNMYEAIEEDKLLFLGWDMVWDKKTFATRSGMKLYNPPKGKQITIDTQTKVLIHYTPSKWMVNGVCRLSEKKKFFEIGGHPKGMVYGVDHEMSIRAEKHGYWIGYYHNPNDLITHMGSDDNDDYRKMKTAYLKSYNAPLHV